MIPTRPRSNRLPEKTIVPISFDTHSINRDERCTSRANVESATFSSKRYFLASHGRIWIEEDGPLNTLLSLHLLKFRMTWISTLKCYSNVEQYVTLIHVRSSKIGLRNCVLYRTFSMIRTGNKTKDNTPEIKQSKIQSLRVSNSLTISVDG